MGAWASKQEHTHTLTAIVRIYSDFIKAAFTLGSAPLGKLFFGVSDPVHTGPLRSGQEFPSVSVSKHPLPFVRSLTKFMVLPVGPKYPAVARVHEKSPS